MTIANRCPTSSGAFRCDHSAGHPGECVTRAPAPPWVGPASRRMTHVDMLQRIGVDSIKRESASEMPRVGATSAPNDLSAPPATHPAADAKTRQGGA
jgi:hypothetical protein